MSSLESILTEYKIPTRLAMVKRENELKSNALNDFIKYIYDEIQLELPKLKSHSHAIIEITNSLVSLYRNILKEICEKIINDPYILVNIYDMRITLVSDQNIISELKTKSKAADFHYNNIEIGILEITNFFHKDSKIGRSFCYNDASIPNRLTIQNIKLHIMDKSDFIIAILKQYIELAESNISAIETNKIYIPLNVLYNNKEITYKVATEYQLHINSIMPYTELSYSMVSFSNSTYRSKQDMFPVLLISDVNKDNKLLLIQLMKNELQAQQKAIQINVLSNKEVDYISELKSKVSMESESKSVQRYNQ